MLKELYCSLTVYELPKHLNRISDCLAIYKLIYRLMIEITEALFAMQEQHRAPVF